MGWCRGYVLDKRYSVSGSFCFHLGFFFFDVVTRRIGYGVGFAYFEDVTVVVALHVDVNGVVGGPSGDADFWFRHDGCFNWSRFTWGIFWRNYSGLGLLLLKGRTAQQLGQIEIESNSI